MIKTSYNRAKWLAGVITIAMIMPLAVFAQTKITYHKNKYSPADDVRLGRQAAAEAERQFPLLNDAEVSAYVERVGQRLVAAIPPEFQHPEFHFYFKVINASDINAFALPGGPMFVDRGMIQAARNEGEMAGVMAHELSHVALRHGTAQATKAQKYAIGAAAAGILGTIFAGPAAGQLVQVPIEGYFLKYSREYETEADILGARIMANAGYDPHDLANMFRTIEAQGGGGGGFLSDHPSPKDRYARINQEAQYLTVSNRVIDNAEFNAIKERLRGYPRAMSMAEIARGGQRYPDQGNQYPSNNRYPSNSRYPGNNPNSRDDDPNPTVGRVDYPSSRYRNYSEFDLVRLSVPDNWRELNDQSSSVWFAPRGAYGSDNGQVVYTHGINVGTAQSQSRSLEQATNDFVNSLEQSSSNLRSRGNYQRTTLDGHSALSISLSNTNESTGRKEMINLVTAQLRNGNLFYVISVAPDAEYSTYQNVFQNVLRSIQFND